jgi:hypothetical protein
MTGKYVWNVRDEKFIENVYEIPKVDEALNRSIKLNCMRV